MLRIGPAGWHYKDWEGVVYPESKPKGFHGAEYLSRFFDTIEINNTFYRPPTPDRATVWAKRVSGKKNFRFTAKLWRGFTQTVAELLDHCQKSPRRPVVATFLKSDCLVFSQPWFQLQRWIVGGVGAGTRLHLRP